MLPLTEIVSYVLLTISWVLVVAALLAVLAGIIGNITGWGPQEDLRRAEERKAKGLPPAPPPNFDPFFFGFFAVVGVVVVMKMTMEAEQFRVVVRVIGGTTLMAVVAGALFALKVTHLRSYALLEMAFAAVVGGKTMSQLADVVQPIEVVTIVAGAYLMIRGLDNFRKDWDSRVERQNAEVGKTSHLAAI